MNSVICKDLLTKWTVLPNCRPSTKLTNLNSLTVIISTVYPIDLSEVLLLFSEKRLVSEDFNPSRLM